MGMVLDLPHPLAGADIPTYTVFGNHERARVRPNGDADYELARKVRSALENAGIPVLENEAVRFKPLGITELVRGIPLYLVATGAEWLGRYRPMLALGPVSDEAPRLALMHNAITSAEFPTGTATYPVGK